VRSLRSRGGPAAADGRGGAPSTRGAFWRGLVTNVLNPKMALFTVALLPQFVDPSRGQVPTQFLVLGACFVAIEIMVDGTVGLAAGRLRRVLARRPRAARGLDLASGSVFVGLAAKLALTR
jgi:threonine/homoserine/homoserine lactone efflux protein